MTKGQAVITEKCGPHNCNVGEDGGFAPNVSRQAFYLKLFEFVQFLKFFTFK
jgi:hypothetical protein